MSLEDVWVPILVALIMSPPLYGLAKSIFKTIRGRNDKETNAWAERDTQRRRADALHEALMSHRTMCHKLHDMPYDEMDLFPRRGKDF